MINEKDNPVERALLLYELDDARERLEALLRQMVKDEKIVDVDFGVQLGYIFAHLNRGWHSRDHKGAVSDIDHDLFSKFPTDLLPR